MPVSVAFRLHVLETIRDIGERFENPDDDWIPVLVTDKGPLPLDFDSEDSKDLMANALMPMVISLTNTKEFAFVSSAWMAQIEAPKEAKDLSRDEMMKYVESNYQRPSEHPNRREVVIVHFGSSDGSNELYMADISRSETEPPQLGEWVRHEDAAGFTGRFVDPLMEAVKNNTD